MLFKVDENLHSHVAVLLHQHNHDALTVDDQGLRGRGDIADVCRHELRAILTLDLALPTFALFRQGIMQESLCCGLATRAALPSCVLFRVSSMR
jgi:hypothetical protein